MNILLLINDDDLFDIIETILCGVGINVYRVKNQIEIHDILIEREIKYCVVDNNNIREVFYQNNSNLEFIVLAGHLDRNLESLKKMFSNVVLKPFDVEDLIKIIQGN